MVFTGDLADKGETEAYLRLRTMVEPVCRSLGARVIWAMGNHDNRANFRAAFPTLRSQQAPDRWTTATSSTACASSPWTPPCPATTTASCPSRSWTGWRRSWPRRRRTARSWRCTTRRCPSVLDLAVLVELRDQAALAAVRARARTSAPSSAGHLHYSTTATFAGIPVSVASATLLHAGPQRSAGGTRGRDGAQAFNLVHVYEHTIVHSVVPGIGRVARLRRRRTHGRRSRCRRRGSPNAGVRISPSSSTEAPAETRPLPAISPRAP